MYLLTINEKQDNGAYAVLNRYGGESSLYV